MNLPKVEVIGLQTAEGVLELLQGDLLVTPVRTDFGHEDNLLATTLNRLAHEFLGSSAVVFPGVVEEGDPCFDGFVQNANGLGLLLDTTPMGAAKTQRRDIHASLAKCTNGKFSGSGARSD